MGHAGLQRRAFSGAAGASPVSQAVLFHARRGQQWGVGGSQRSDTRLQLRRQHGDGLLAHAVAVHGPGLVVHQLRRAGARRRQNVPSSHAVRRGVPGVRAGTRAERDRTRRWRPASALPITPPTTLAWPQQAPPTTCGTVVRCDWPSPCSPVTPPTTLAWPQQALLTTCGTVVRCDCRQSPYRLSALSAALRSPSSALLVVPPALSCSWQRHSSCKRGNVHGRSKMMMDHACAGRSAALGSGTAPALKGPFKRRVQRCAQGAQLLVANGTGLPRAHTQREGA